MCPPPRDRASEDESDRALHHPRRSAGVDLAEQRIGLLAGRIERGGRVDAAELRVVEQGVDLPAQLQIPPPTPERNPLEERDVPVVHAGQTDVVFVAAANVAARWPCVDA